MGKAYAIRVPTDYGWITVAARTKAIVRQVVGDYFDASLAELGALRDRATYTPDAPPREAIAEVYRDLARRAGR